MNNSEKCKPPNGKVNTKRGKKFLYRANKLGALAAVASEYLLNAECPLEQPARGSPLPPTEPR